MFSATYHHELAMDGSALASRTVHNINVVHCTSLVTTTVHPEHETYHHKCVFHSTMLLTLVVAVLVILSRSVVGQRKTRVCQTAIAATNLFCASFAIRMQSKSASTVLELTAD